MALGITDSCPFPPEANVAMTTDMFIKTGRAHSSDSRNHHFLLHPKKKSQQPMGWNLGSGHNGALPPSSGRQA